MGTDKSGLSRARSGGDTCATAERKLAASLSPHVWTPADVLEVAEGVFGEVPAAVTVLVVTDGTLAVAAA
jgi:hypothetical protein